MSLLVARRGSLHRPRFAPAYYDEVLADNPIGLWKLDEPSGTTAADSSGNGRTAVYVGSTLDQAGPSAEIPKSVLTDGVDDKVWTGTQAAFNIPASGTWSMETWFRTTSTATVLCALGWRGDGVATSEGTGLLFVNLASVGSVSLGLSDPSSNFFSIASGNVGSNDGDWHHLAATSVASGSARLYFDGTEVASSAAARSTATSNRRMRAANNRDTQWFPGNLAAIGFHNTELSAARVLTHYNAAGL